MLNLLYEKYKNDLKSELISKNSFTFLISVVLSARTRDQQVNIATEKLFKVVNTPHDIVNMGVEKLKSYIKNIGLYKNKAQNIFLLSQQLIAKGYIKNIPNTFEELVQLPGVGTKTAHVVLNEIFKKPYVAVDTHVFRVARRMELSKSKTIEGVSKDLNKIRTKYKQYLHNILIQHGKTTCKTRPQCDKCVISRVCKKIV